MWQRIQASPNPMLWALALAGLIVAVTAILLYKTVGQTTPLILQLSPSFFFWLGMGYMALLLLAAAVFHIYRSAPGPTLVGGILPIAVPWFGALGAVTISLEGVFLFNSQWEHKFNYWHIGRPLFGAVLGIVAFFIFIVIVSAAGSAPNFLDGRAPSLGKDYIIFYVVAFLVGYREATFRELIKRATDLVLKPGATAATAAALTIKVNGKIAPTIDFPQTAAGTTSKLTVEVQNSGTVPVTSPTATLTADAGTTTGVFSIVDQVSGKGDLAPSRSRTVEVSFTPPATGTFGATLTIAAANLAAPKTLRVTGQS
jgi:hypothetical protein